MKEITEKWLQKAREDLAVIEEIEHNEILLLIKTILTSKTAL